eukprot:SAG22_NODE_321_length_12398_cov_3.218392_10_plen_175_part_00
MLKGGGNFSAGERQALAMGRTVLHARRIIAMDEPTANIDAKTDELLQKMLRKMFAGRTLLCIAHRLQTVIEMDKIAVMANGKLAEFDEPDALLNGAADGAAAAAAAAAQQPSELAAMVDACGAAAAASLRSSAAAAAAARRQQLKLSQAEPPPAPPAEAEAEAGAEVEAPSMQP